MTGRDKAAQILAKLTVLHMPMSKLTVEDVQYKCPEQMLDFYYFWICCDGYRRSGG